MKHLHLFLESFQSSYPQDYQQHKNAYRYARGMKGGDALRLLRERRGWTQTELAARLGIHQAGISARERGEVRLREREHDDLAKAFGMPRQQWDAVFDAALAEVQGRGERTAAVAAEAAGIPDGFALISTVVPEWTLAYLRAAQAENVGGTDGSLFAAMLAAYALAPAAVRRSLRRWAAWRTVNPPAEVDIAEAAPLMAVDPEPAVFRQDADNTPSPPGVTPQRQKRMERVLSLTEEPVQHEGFWSQVHRMITLADLPPTEAAPSPQAPPRTASGG